MKRLRKLDLDSMERELQVLNVRETELIAGGTDIWDWVVAAVKDLMGIATNNSTTAMFAGISIYENHTSSSLGSRSDIEIMQEDTRIILESLVPYTVGLGIHLTADKVSEINANMTQRFRELQSNPIGFSLNNY